jgi:DNA topoisomerase I
MKRKNTKKKIKKKWTNFTHNGVLFHYPYIPHKTPIIYNNKKIMLSPIAEEYASLYAKCIDSCNITNKFIRNFWNSWKPTLKNTIIKNFDSCDFTLIKKYMEQKKEHRSSIPLEERKKKSSIKSSIIDDFRTAKLDNNVQKVGNVIVEPPGIFIGRGTHPKMGTIKTRINPENVTINIEKDAIVPNPKYLSRENKLITMKNNTWGEIIHDNTVEWVASWTDNVSGKKKYVWLSDACKFKASSDMKKFDIARKLKKKIGYIRTNIGELIDSSEIKESQVGTAIYLIDNLALRVGNEKGSDKADTVGVTSLRVEHIKLHGNNILVLDFLGKDSMRYYNSIRIDSAVYNNLIEFIKDKSPKDQLFDLVTSCDINESLQNYIKDLTAKSFRTYNASHMFQHKLRKIMKKYENKKTDLTKEDIKDILKMFERANIDVAKLCNHQKTVSKGSIKHIDRLKDKINEVRHKKKNLQAKKRRKRTKGIVNKITKLNKKLKELKEKVSYKSEIKSISLTTSKVNYIDPRIIFGFAKFFDLSIDNFYAKTLIKKFSWASDVPQTWKF